jgi:hypothetical protein
MAFDPEFMGAVYGLNRARKGLEAVGPLLYSLVRMTRPVTLLETGFSYATPFIAQALADAVAEHEQDRAIIAGDLPGDGRESLLRPGVERLDYRPRLLVIDDPAAKDSQSEETRAALATLDLESFVTVHEGGFAGAAETLPLEGRALDFVWFDAQGVGEDAGFLREYWPKVSTSNGLLLLHFAHWPLQVEHDGQQRPAILPSPLVNELKRQQVEAGGKARFEFLSLLEPHKLSQASVTMIRKLPPSAALRPLAFPEEMRQITGKDWEAPPHLG